MAGGSMKYRVAPLLVLLAVAAAAQAPAPKDDNRVEIGTEAFIFHPEKLLLSRPNRSLKGKKLFRLLGHLVPDHGEPIRLELTATGEGQIYLLKMTRARGKGEYGEYNDAWAATVKTRVEVLKIQAEKGGVLLLRLSGPLAATLHNGGGATAWRGEIQARFDGV